CQYAVGVIMTKFLPIAPKRPRKKKWLRVLIVLLVFVCLLCTGGGVLPARTATSEEEAAMEELEKQIDELLASLDTEELQAYLDTLSEFKGTSVKEKLLGLITGDYALDYGSLSQSILSFIWEEWRTFLAAFAVILAVALLCGVLNSVKNGFLHSTMSDIIHFVGYISVGAVVLSCLMSVLNSGYSTVQAMRKQMEIVYPLLLTLMAASGGAVSAQVYRPAVAFMSGAICELFASVVMPTSVIVIVLAFVGNLSQDVRTEKLGDFFKSVSKWLIGFSLGLFSLFLTVQGITSAQYDGMSLRAAKYVISGSVPIVGGFLSGGVEVVLAGSALIKNALGSFSIFLLVTTILRPVILFAVFQLFLRLSAAATEPVGGKISSFLSRLAQDSGYFLASVLCVAFLYFLTLLLLIFSSGVIL
ncbi:MAG: stage III sporulation protein AE, partial [Clostridiales bacterium]|nr:stage III sporulation protein AE [Clostridiales bacterium]